MATKIMECDLVVLGAGGTGLVAAVKAADESGKRVIVLEKAKKPGGALTFAHVFAIKDSKWQKEAGETVNDPPSLSGQFFDWLVTKGGAEEYFRMIEPGDKGNFFFGNLRMYKRLDKYKDLPDATIGPGWTGTYIIEKMLECCKKIGIPVVTGARAKKFVTDATGKVTGVLADTADGELQVNCKACYIGSGGFGADYEKCRKLWPADFNYVPMMSLAPPTNTGDCIDMAREIGAAIDLETAWITIASMVHHPYSYSVFCMVLNKNDMMPRPELLLVNLNGERWMMPHRPGGHQSGYNPNAKFDLKTNSPAAFPTPLSDVPGGAIWAIADSHTTEILAKNMIADEIEVTAVPVLEKWREELAYEAALDDKKTAHGNHTKKADTLEELALKMDVDPKVFVATVERYNKLCDEGKDSDFGKDPASLIPIRNPPYYAIWAYRFTQMTEGGIVINDDMEVLDTKGNVMPGLFAGGNDTKGGFGFKERRRAPTLGYVAGINAAKYLKSLG